MKSRSTVLFVVLSLLSVVSDAGSLHLGAVSDDGLATARLGAKELLPEEVGQPFEPGYLEHMRILEAIASYRPRGFWSQHLSFLDEALLKDYLDADSIPTSFVIPSVETCPMVCAVSLSADRMKVTKTTRDSKNQWGGERSGDTIYSLDPSMFQSMSVSAQVVFPFRYAHLRRSRNYKCQCMVKFFLGNNNDTSLRAGSINENDELSASEDWKGSAVKMGDRAITFLSSINLPMPSNDELTTDNMSRSVEFRGFSTPYGTEDKPLLKVVRRYSSDTSGGRHQSSWEHSTRLDFFLMTLIGVRRFLNGQPLLILTRRGEVGSELHTQFGCGSLMIKIMLWMLRQQRIWMTGKDLSMRRSAAILPRFVFHLNVGAAFG